MERPEPHALVRPLGSGQARFVLTSEASFFVPGVIRGSRGTADVHVRSMRGELLGRPIVTIPPEEASG